MKYRSRKYKKVSDTPSYWPSFVDMMSTMALVFLFLMLVYSGISKQIVDHIVDNRVNLYEEIDELLKKNKVDEELMSFDQKKGILKIETDTFFDINESILTQEGRDTANILGDIFYNLLSDSKINESIKYIEIIGHTDYIGSTIENRTLSTERAMSFLNAIMPMNSDLENEFGNKFKASGMSEFENNTKKEERDRTVYEDEDEAATQRKIEVKIQFNEKDIDDAVANRMNNK